jgi:hypothetical protein
MMGRMCRTQKRDEKYIQNFGLRTEWTISLGRYGRKWKDNIKTKHNGIGCEDVVWLRIGSSGGLLIARI